MTNLMLLLAWGSLLFSPTSIRAYNIAIIPKMRAAEAFYGKTAKGCEDYSNATQGKLTCIYRGAFEPDVEENLRWLNELIDDDTVDGISISVLDPDAYAPVINRGMALGKPIITFDSDAPLSNRLAYVGTNNVAMGRELAKLLKQVRPVGGTYGIVSGFGNSDSLNERVRGVREVLADTPWKEVEGSPKNGKEDSHISLQQMWVLMEEYPDLDAIVSVVGLPMFPEPTTNWTTFVDAHRNVLTVIADALPVQLDLMQTSYVDALVGQLPYNMGYQSAETLLKVLEAVDSGIPLNQTLLSDTIFGTHQLEILRIPLELPPLDFDYNYIGKAAIVGYILCGIIIVSALAFMAWTWIYKKNQVVRSGQPVFLTMICIGCLLMGSAIIPLSIDDEKSQRAADIACMCSPWLINVGFTIAFSALFSKTWRLNKILLSKDAFRRVTVTEKDVMWPLVVLLTLNIIALICWTTIAPLKYVRTLEAGTDPWNRHIGSYGQCRSTSGAAGDSIPYTVVIGVVNVTALVVANFQAYRARNVRTEFNESSYIAMANASFLQAIFICVPIIFLTRTNPQAYYIVISVVLFILSGAILVFIFVPKVIALREGRKQMASGSVGRRQSSMIGSGSSGGSTKYGSSRRASSMIRMDSARSSTGDPVADALQSFQSLSWEGKMAFKQKLSLTSAVATSSSKSLLDHQLDAVGESPESDAEASAPMIQVRTTEETHDEGSPVVETKELPSTDAAEQEQPVAVDEEAP